MRIERRKIGTRIRVILNRTEARDAGRLILISTGKILPTDKATDIPIRIGGRDRYAVRQSAFEESCRVTASKQIIIPKDADMRIAVDDDGQVTGVTFQFFEQED